MDNYFSSNFRLGVLGGGQLGRMLLTETQKLDIFTVILDGSAEAPCAQICNEFHQGDLLHVEAGAFRAVGHQLHGELHHRRALPAIALRAARGARHRLRSRFQGHQGDPLHIYAEAFLAFK